MGLGEKPRTIIKSRRWPKAQLQETTWQLRWLDRYIGSWFGCMSKWNWWCHHSMTVSLVLATCKTFLLKGSLISFFPNVPLQVIDHVAIKIPSLVFVKLDPTFMPWHMKGTHHVSWMYSLMNAHVSFVKREMFIHMSWRFWISSTKITNRIIRPSSLV